MTFFSPKYWLRHRDPVFGTEPTWDVPLGKPWQWACFANDSHGRTRAWWRDLGR